MNKIKKLLKSLDRFLFPAIYNRYDHLEDIIAKEILKDCKTVLDVGCGVTANSPLLKIAPKLENIVGIDLFKPSIDKNKLNPVYNEYLVANAMDIDTIFSEKSFDCVIATDLIEHLEPEAGQEFLRKAEKIAKKKIIIFTPNGYINQDEYEENIYQVHKSGWKVVDFRKQGFGKVYGINGWKILRGEMATIKFKPEWFWFRISLLSQKITNHLPRFSFQLLGVKKIK